MPAAKTVLLPRVVEVPLQRWQDVPGSKLRPWSVLGAGVELIVPVLVAMYLGYRLDRWLETEPWFLIGMSVLGIATGFVQFFRSVLPRRSGGSPGWTRAASR